MKRQAKDTYVLLKREFQSTAFRSILKTELGATCANCGSENDIEYHHIVPLSLCGTNRLSNIVPLCYYCHKVAHGSRNIRRICKAEVTGRPRKNLPSDSMDTIEAFMRGKITRATCYERLGLKGATKLTDLPMYQDLLAERGIVRFRNLTTRPKTNPEAVVSYIVYKDGTMTEYLLDGTERTRTVS